MSALRELPLLLEQAGVNVRVMDGWQDAHNDGSYVWREDGGEPAGHMHHHTATTSYAPNRLKANGYAGLSYEGSDRLFQERYLDVGYEPVYTIANLYPAPISSGSGDITVLERVQAGIGVVGRQGTDTPGWYGNAHYWNTEWILDGTGSHVDLAVWDMMVTVCQVQNDLMGWTENMHIGHGHHTRRKIDLWAGRYADFDDTIIALRTDITEGDDEMTFQVWANGWYDALYIEDLEKMHAAGVVTGNLPYWVNIWNKNADDRTLEERKAVAHFYASAQADSWSNR